MVLLTITRLGFIMLPLQWRCDPLKDIQNEELYSILKLRVDVFVVEQHCAYQELDDKDLYLDTYHLRAYQQDELVAYARLMRPGLNYPETSIGRFVVKKTFRGQGIGTLLLEKSVKQIKYLWPEASIKLSAQSHLEDFYARLGFIATSEEYLEDGIPHIEMLRL